ncbi:TcpQ domain-containing protein [Acidihalobacter prosperus]|nr:TcpQ domain-containing protein [Acidihalobacter prosperus]
MKRTAVIHRGLGSLAAAGLIPLLGGCAATQPKVPAGAIPGYVFGYHVVSDHGPKAQIVSGEHDTWFALPADARLLEAKGDGKNVPFHKQGAYWTADKVATQWTLYTSKGPVFAVAPKSVGVILAAEHQARFAKPRYAWHTDQLTLTFRHGAALTPADQQRLAALDARLDAAHQVAWIRVSGQTTASGSMTANAKIGAARAAVVAGWLTAHGAAPVSNLGWTPGANAKAALVAARYQVRVPKPVKIVHPPIERVHPPVKAAPGHGRPQAPTAPLKSTPMTAVNLTPKPPTSFVFRTHAGDLLSHDLAAFLKRQGWSMVWRDPNDYALQYPARYTGKTLDNTLRQIVDRYRVRIVLYRANHVAVVEAGAAE